MGYINNKGEYVNNLKTKRIEKKCTESTVDNTPKMSLIVILLYFSSLLVPIYMLFNGHSWIEAFVSLSFIAIFTYLYELIAEKRGLTLTIFIVMGILFGLKNGGSNIIAGIVVGTIVGGILETINKYKF